MKNHMKRIALFASQAIFSIITPPLLIPKIGNLRLTRSLISFFFGRLYGNRYEDIIASFQGRYGLAMAEGMAQAKKRVGRAISVIADCGAGTGFVTRQAAQAFPGATIVAFDLLSGMLEQARKNCEGIAADIYHVQADSFALPLADESIDLLLAQNTMPCFTEFARVCRPGGMVIYVDSSAGWIGNLAKKLVKKQGLFGTVDSGRVGTGFYILAQKGGGDQWAACGPLEEEVRDNKLLSLLRCPLDKGRLVPEEGRLVCSRGHSYDSIGKFPVML